jgi:4-alpha-glucanotransferase
MSPTLKTRAGGVLLHPSSLPGPHGIGDLGESALRFAEWLASAGQTWWQMLPVGPTGWGNSPYSARSSFAGNPLLLSLHRLADDGLLESRDLVPDPSLRPGKVDFEAVAAFKNPRLRRAFAAFERAVPESELAAFRSANPWASDDALYAALAHVRRGAWWDWEPGIRQHEPGAVGAARRELDREVRYYEFLQFQFDRQWRRLRAHAAALGIGLIGDVPFFAAPDSVDVWGNQDHFDLDAEGRPRTVAGAPPDGFNADGQRWGHPQYRWDVHRTKNYAWWIDRLRVTFQRFDAVRIDHFIGFHRSWSIPASCPTAREGAFRPGPGEEFFRKLYATLGPLELIAEDLGVVPPEVEQLRDGFNLPGIRVLQFGLNGDPGADLHLPHKYPVRCVAATGTHDNDTSAGWFNSLWDPKARDFARNYIGGDRAEVPWDMIRVVSESRADTVVVPVQDLLGLGSDARMNRPGVAQGNWDWRLADGALGPSLGQRLRALTEATGRIPR